MDKPSSGPRSLVPDKGEASKSRNTDRMHQLYPAISYANGGRSQLLSPIRDGPDDPGSPNFIPLDKRGEIGQARFWARQNMRQLTRQEEAETDA